MRPEWSGASVITVGGEPVRVPRVDCSIQPAGRLSMVTTLLRSVWR
jgi:hypothetical protein